MTNVTFVPGVRTDKKNSTGSVPLVIKAYLNNTEIAHPSLKKRIMPEDWDGRKVRDTNPNHKLLNGIISNKINQYENFVLRRQTLQLPVTKEILLKYFKAEGGSENFFTEAKDIINTRITDQGHPLEEDTKRRYNDELIRLARYREKIHFRDITDHFLAEYKTWMQSYGKEGDKPLSKNSIWKALGVIRMIYKEAIKRKIITGENNPFTSFKVGSYEQDLSKIKYLELPDLEKLEQTLLEKPMPDLTNRIGWRFLTMCVCGMRISDAMGLDDMYFNDAGDLQFKPFKTRKYDNTAQVPMKTERQKRYLQKTLSLPIPYTNHKSFRTTFNDHLKVLGAMAGIGINLTSHCGRHTMGGFIVDAGIDTKAGMKMLGIKDEKVIKTYLHLKQSKLQSEADKLGGVM